MQTLAARVLALAVLEPRPSSSSSGSVRESRSCLARSEHSSIALPGVEALEIRFDFGPLMIAIADERRFDFGHFET